MHILTPHTLCLVLVVLPVTRMMMQPLSPSGVLLLALLQIPTSTPCVRVGINPTNRGQHPRISTIPRHERTHHGYQYQPQHRWQSIYQYSLTPALRHLSQLHSLVPSASLPLTSLLSVSLSLPILPTADNAPSASQAHSQIAFSDCGAFNQPSQIDNIPAE